MYSLNRRCISYRARRNASGARIDQTPGAIKIDPTRPDFFKVVIEERKRLSLGTDLSNAEKEKLDKALKVLANAASYGIYEEMNRQESDQKRVVTCYGIDAHPFTCRVAHPDAPAEYCFPPLASLIAGAARLMLALLEHYVVELGGHMRWKTPPPWLLLPRTRECWCHAGGIEQMVDGRDAVEALSSPPHRTH